MKEEEARPILFVTSKDNPATMTDQGVRVGNLISVLESKGFFGGVLIKMQNGKISHSNIEQALRI